MQVSSFIPNKTADITETSVTKNEFVIIYILVYFKLHIYYLSHCYSIAWDRL